jgi:hypothetical protein
MTGVGPFHVKPRPACRSRHPSQQGSRQHARRSAGECAVDPTQYSGRARRLGGEGDAAQKVPHLPHGGGRVLVMARYVADDEHQRSVGCLEPVVPVAAQLGELDSWLVSHRQLRPTGSHRGRKEAALERLGHGALHLGDRALSAADADAGHCLPQGARQQTKKGEVPIVGSQLAAQRHDEKWRLFDVVVDQGESGDVTVLVALHAAGDHRSPLGGRAG